MPASGFQGGADAAAADAAAVKRAYNRCVTKTASATEVVAYVSSRITAQDDDLMPDVEAVAALFTCKRH
jgi:hypothetical protein